MLKLSNSFDECVIPATDEKLTKEDWALMSVVCEKVYKAGDQGARDCISSIQKRLIHRNANVQLYALTLTNTLVKECGISIHKEVCSRAFTSTLTKMLNDRNTHDVVKNRILDLIQEWCSEFRSNPSLSIMEETYRQLRSQNFQFPPQKPQKEPNEDKGLPQPPSVSRVRALYDFRPTESNELGFSCGDIINVIDNVYKDWWKGELHGKTGIFPVNYVEKISDPSPVDIAKELEMEVNVFSQGKNIERLLELLESFDPQKDSVTTNEDIQNLYNETVPIRPKLTILVEKYTKKKDYLIELHTKFTKAISTYEQLMNDSFSRYTNPKPIHPGYITPQGYVAPNSTFIGGYPNSSQQIYSAPNPVDSTISYNQHTDQQQQQNVYQAQQYYPMGHQNGYPPNQQSQYGSQAPQQQYQQSQYVNPQDPTQQYQLPQYMNPQDPTQQMPQQPQYMNPQDPTQQVPQQPQYMNPQDPTQQ
ncbi:19707_t:CDS:10, partial [Cetraspora pellucida]